MTFWYVAPVIGRTFIEAAQGSSSVQPEGEGVYRAYAWGHHVYFVSVQDLPRKVGSLPLLLLDESTAPSMAGVFEARPELVGRFNRWLLQFRPQLWQEVTGVPEVPRIDDQKIAEALRNRPDVLRAIGPDVVEMLGVSEVVKAVGPEKALDEILALLTPEQVQELLRRKTQQPPPAPDGTADSATPP